MIQQPNTRTSYKLVCGRLAVLSYAGVLDERIVEQRKLRVTPRAKAISDGVGNVPE